MYQKIWPGRRTERKASREIRLSREIRTDSLEHRAGRRVARRGNRRSQAIREIRRVAREHQANRQEHRQVLPTASSRETWTGM